MSNNLTSRFVSLAARALLVGGVLFAGSAEAQTPEQRRAAGAAFDQGTTAMLASDFRAAAHFFEQAYHLAPAAVALKQAIRAHDRAGNSFRAANLALRLRDQYPNDAEGQALAAEVIGRYAPQYTEVHATCQGCTILANDALVAENVVGTVAFFVQPGSAVRITAQYQFATGEVDLTADITGNPGESMEIPAFETPEAPPAPEPPPGTTVGPGGQIVVVGGGGTPPVIFYTMLGVTAAAGGFTIWSGVDTLAGVDAYEAAAAADDPNAARLLANGQDKEMRTNIGIGVTAGFGVLATVFAITADWDGDPEVGETAPSARRGVQGLAASVAPSRDGASLVIGGRF